MNQIKLYFLTGFLGSGKTTLLKNLLENMEGMKVGVIQNELGKISIDGTVLQNDDIHMVELNRGSIFCSCLRLSFVDVQLLCFFQRNGTFSSRLLIQRSKVYLTARYAGFYILQRVTIL